MNLRTFKLAFGRVRKGQIGERLDGPLAGVYGSVDLCFFLREQAPIATMQARTHNETLRIGIIRPDGDKLLSLGNCLLITPELVERGRAITKRIGAMGIERQGLVEPSKCPLQASLAKQGNGTVHYRLNVLRLQRQRTLKTGDGLAVAPRFQKSVSTVEPRACIIWIDRERAFEALQGFGIALELE